MSGVEGAARTTGLKYFRPQPIPACKERFMSSYPIQANSLVSHATQAEPTNQPNRPAATGANQASALPQDTVAISPAARAQQAAVTAQSHATANAPPPNTAQKG